MMQAQRHPPPATVLVADDHALVREGMKALVTDVLSGVHFAEAADWDALICAAQDQPEARLALIDLSMPGMRGGLRLFEFVRRHPQIPLAVISPESPPTFVRHVMHFHSVYAYMPRNTETNIMRQAIEAAIGRQKFAFAAGARSSSQPALTLSPRREDVLKLLRQGMSNKMIASALGITTGTVKNHVTEIFKLLNATSHTQAARASFETE